MPYLHANVDVGQCWLKTHLDPKNNRKKYRSLEYANKEINKQSKLLTPSLSAEGPKN